MKSLFATLFSATFFTILGCSGPTTPIAAPQANAVAQVEHEEHIHPPGPHGGTVFDWGGGAYHVEFTVDHENKEATVFFLGSDQKSPAPIKAQTIHLRINDPMTELDLVAKPLEGEPGGMSSRFVGRHDTIGIEREFAGTVSGVIEDTPYSGDFKDEPHGTEHKP